MSARSISGNYRSEIEQIESVAETKGIELDDIVVNETTTDDGDDLVVFRVYETKADDDVDSVGVQVSKMPSVQTGDMTFRNDVQNKLMALKKHLAGEQPSDRVDEGRDSDDVSDSQQSDETAQEQRESRTRTRDTASIGGAGPGAEIDARLRDIEDHLDELESRVSELEDKSEALDGLQKLVGNTTEE